MRVSTHCDPQREQGSYTIEGALTLTIFTICMMALITILSVIKVEAEIQDALDETALELSQYAYVMGRTEYLKDAAEEHLPGLTRLFSLDGEDGFSDLALTGPGVAKLLAKENFARDDVDGWLKRQGVSGGYEGLDFRDTTVLMDGKTITVAVSYDLNINTYGLFRKVLHQRIAAVTYGLLPTDAALKAMRAKPDETSIWQESNFVRGQYFASAFREEGHYGVPVRPGQGIDLYDAATGTYAEVESLNLFLPTYSSLRTPAAGGSGNTGSGTAGSAFADAASYVPRADSIEKALFGYTKGLTKDISKLDGEVVLADGSTVTAVPPQKKVLVLIVPEETRQNEAMDAGLQKTASEAGRKYGVDVVLRYEQKALISTGEGQKK